MRRRELLLLAVSSAASASLLPRLSKGGIVDKWSGKNLDLSIPGASATNPIDAQVQVDWATVVAQTTLSTFGSNDYEITKPKDATDPVYQRHLANLGIGLIRIHHAGLCESWTDPVTKTWNEAKIQIGYDASYPQRPTIIQNIPGWPDWMAQNQDGLLDPSEYDRYAAFCAELVEILNQRQQRKIEYWEPLNEKDVRYTKAGQLDELWTIYNKVATAMKHRDPQIKVGGPALTWDNTRILASFLQACGSNVDFISWHRYASGDASDSTDKLMSYTPEYGEQVRRFREVTMQYIPDRQVPLLLGEYNINYSWESGEKRQHTHIGAVWFASVLKHLAEAEVDMAASWHLKDGIYGLIDRENNLRPAATVFAWGIQYLIGRVMHVESNHKFVEALAVQQPDKTRSLLLINKSAELVRLRLQFIENMFKTKNLSMLYLDAKGVTKTTLSRAMLESESLMLKPYSLALLRF